MATPLCATTIATIKATIPALEVYGLDITSRMYARLFETPELAALFNKSHHTGAMTQPKALASAVLAYATYIETPEVLAAAIERIAQKHTSLHILEEHYAPVGAALLGAISDVLGEAATPEILAAWGEAYGFLADVLIGREAQIYAGNSATLGGWTGWRALKVTERRAENPFVTTLRLAPADGSAVMAQKPGQYLALALGDEGLRRNYSISCAPNTDFYEITVKRDGQGSTWLHENALVGSTLQVAAPAGDFVFTPTQNKIAFIAGGVGLTPLRAMLGALSAEELARTTVLHAVRTPSHALAIPANGARVVSLFTDTEGPLSLERIAAETDLAQTDYYICGPKGFMKLVIEGLQAKGVCANRLKYEFFGPAEAL